MKEDKKKGAEPKRQGETNGNQDGGCAPLVSSEELLLLTHRRELSLHPGVL